jgi:hypothetical protein
MLLGDPSVGMMGSLSQVVANYIVFGNGTPYNMLSADSIAWTQVAAAARAWGFPACWSGTTFCVIEYVNQPVNGQNTIVCATAADGINWTYGTMPNTLSSSGYAPIYNDVCWNGSIFVAVGGSGNNDTTYCATSSDGVNWTQRTMPGTGTEWRGVVWNGSVFCAVGNGTSTTIATSPDGITWTSRRTGGTWADVCWTGSQFCAVNGTGAASGANLAITSPNGITWTLRTIQNKTLGTFFNTIAWDGTFLVIAGGNGLPTQRSNDGITWVTGAISGTTASRIRAIASGKLMLDGTRVTTDGGQSFTTVQTTIGNQAFSSKYLQFGAF